MSEQNEKKYKQLALFSVIVAEVVITPSIFGLVTHYLLKGKSIQIPATVLASLLGLVVAFYRIYQLYKIQDKK
jgi:hypothetical protein